MINQTSGSFQKLTKSIKSPSGTLGQLRSGQFTQAIVDTDRVYGVNPKYRDNSTNSSLSKSSQDKLETENQLRIKNMLHFEKSNNKMKQELISSLHSHASFLEKTKFTLNIFHNSRRDQAALLNLIGKKKPKNYQNHDLTLFEKRLKMEREYACFAHNKSLLGSSIDSIQ